MGAMAERQRTIRNARRYRAHQMRAMFEAWKRQGREKYEAAQKAGKEVQDS